jgi:hypothetical protein
LTILLMLSADVQEMYRGYERTLLHEMDCV